MNPVICLYAALGAAAGWAAVWAYRCLPAHWLCDYDQAPLACHAAARRVLPIGAMAPFAMGVALCAGRLGALYGVQQAACWPLQMGACALLIACLVAVLMLAALCDAQYTILPDQLLVCAGLIVLALWAMGGLRAVHANGYSLAIGAVLGFVGLLLVQMVAGKIYKTEAMGFGDVKLLAVLGGLCGPRVLGVAVLLAVVLGGAVLGTLLLCGKVTRRSTVAFGPFLVAGAMGALCLWPQWCALGTWYVGLFA